jgi:hypothetical protein
MLGALGCQANNHNTDLLVAEARQKEDRVYKLQDYIEQYQQMLEACQHENESLRAQLAGGAPGAMVPAKPIPRTQREPLAPGAPSRGSTAPPKMRDVLEIPGAPDVQIGEPFVPDRPGGPVPKSRPAPPKELPVPGPIEGELPSPDSAIPRGDAATLAFNRMLTGGLDADNQPGDEGVMIVLEPRDEAGELIAPLGQLSLLLVDPKTKQNIARWDFSDDDAAGAFRQTATARGLHFALPWPDEPPAARKLQVHARLVKPNGAKLLIDQEIKIEPQRAQAGNKAPAWSRSTRPIPKARPGSRVATTKRSRTADWNLHDIAGQEADEDASERESGIHVRRPTRPATHNEPVEEEAEGLDRPEWTPFR